MFGVYAILIAVVDNLVQEHGFKSHHSAIAGLSLTICGVIGAFVVSAMLDRNKKYLYTYKVLCILSLITCVMLAASLKSGNEYLLIANMALFGAFSVPCQPLGLTFCLELSHPVSEAMSNSIILLMAEMVAFTGTYIATELIQHSSMLCIAFFSLQLLSSCIIN